MRKPYERFPAGVCGWEYRELELLPECKSVSERDQTTKYQKARKRFLGVIPYTCWVNEADIRWYNEPKVEYYNCDWVGDTE